jgi:N-acetylglucosamine-6-sulfatase
MMRSRPLVALLLVTPSLALIGSTAITIPTVGGALQRPNIVVIVTDDQRWDALQSMPNVKRLLQQRGVTFTNSFVPNALCCPSRSSTLTGLHSHTTGVWGITAPNGGFGSFKDQTTIATVLHDAGYRTMLVGKYLNAYPEGHYPYVPPGWDRWFSTTSGAYYNYFAADNGRRSSLFGTTPAAYSGRVLKNRAISELASVPPGQPFFLYFAPSAPHAGIKTAYAVPDPRDVDALKATLTPYRPPPYGTTDPVTDMPAYIRANTWSSSSVDMFRRRQLESLIGVDRSIGQLMARLPADTLVIFTSDNGYLWGEHKWHAKQVPYEESIRVPMIVRWDGHVPAGSVDPRMALNVDIAPTVATAAGIDPTTAPLGLDRSGTPVLAEGLDLFGAAERDGFVLEHYDNFRAVPPFCGMRTADGWMYARYWDGREADPDNGFEELYHVAVDPYELHNVAPDPAARTTLIELRQRAKVACSPAPPFYSWGL